jgi:N4-bis(aminopropyl)spermidine synthase
VTADRDGLADAHQVLAAVAQAVSLQEGEAGVLRVLRVLAGPGPSATRAVSRASGLPVPVVAAVQNELRSRGFLTRLKPAALSPEGVRLARALCVAAGSMPVEVVGFDGRGTVPAHLQPVVDELADLMTAAPAVDLSLDQSFCTPESKVRRVLMMIATGGLPTPGLLAVGDDDLVSLAVVAVGRVLGIRLVGELGVLDVSADLLDFLAEQLGRTGPDSPTPVLVRHDLREPLPEQLRGRFTVAMTDPPYTVPGARLFLARALEGLRPGPGRDLYFHFGPKGPADWLEICAGFGELGLATWSMTRNFSEYQGSGVLGGVSHAVHLVTAGSPDPLGQYRGLLYTAELRAAAREYTCMGCGERYLVGPGREPAGIAVLKQAGCDRCGGTRFRPGRLVADAPGAGPAGTDGAITGATPTP